MWLDVDQIIPLALICHGVYFGHMTATVRVRRICKVMQIQMIFIPRRYFIPRRLPLSSQLVGLCRPANYQPGEDDKGEMDSSINRLVTHHLLTRPQHAEGNTVLGLFW